MIRRVYAEQRAAAGGTWHTHIAAVGATGVPEPLVADDADHVTHGYSVQKLAVATAVLEKVDRGRLSLGRRLDLPAGIVLGGSGIYHLQTVWGDRVTLANVLTAMLLVSDNTAVRMCGRVAPAAEINEILAGKGFVHTRVEPVADPHRFRLGTTTPRETHDLLWRLVTGTLLGPASSRFLLGVLRSLSGYHDGVRRTMSSAERARVATKGAADFDTRGAARRPRPGHARQSARRVRVTGSFRAPGPGEGRHPMIAVSEGDLMSAAANPATVEECLRVGTGFSQGDRTWIAEQFATLDARLAAFHADTTELAVSVKDREVRGQKVTLECWIAGRQKIVTTSAEEDLRAALNDVRDDLRRRLNDAKTKQEPRHNRHLREHVEPESAELQQ